MKDVNYWLNNLEGNNDKIQPRTIEEDISCQVAEYLYQREQEKHLLPQKKEKIAA